MISLEVTVIAGQGWIRKIYEKLSRNLPSIDRVRLVKKLFERVTIELSFGKDIFSRLLCQRYEHL